MKTIDLLGIRKAEEKEASDLVNYLLTLALDAAQHGKDQVIVDLAATDFGLSHHRIASRVLSRDHGLRVRVDDHTVIMWGWSEA